jgi:hypothetical protein
MSNTNRKARKAAGIAFAPKPAKVPTPILERSFFAMIARPADGTKNAGNLMPRSASKQRRELEARGIFEEGA